MRGINEILYIKIGNENGIVFRPIEDLQNKWLPIACLTDNPISETTDTIATTTRDNNGWDTFYPTTQSATISFSALLPDDEVGKAGYYYLRNIKRNRLFVKWRIKNEKTKDVDYGEGIITELSKASPADDDITFNGTILVSGAINNFKLNNDLQYVGFPYVITNLSP